MNSMRNSFRSIVVVTAWVASVAIAGAAWLLVEYGPGTAESAAARFLLVSTFWWIAAASGLTAWTLGRFSPVGWTAHFFFPLVCGVASFGLMHAAIAVMGSAAGTTVSGGVDFLAVHTLAKLSDGMVASAFLTPTVLWVAGFRVARVATLLCAAFGLMYAVYFVVLP